MEERGSDHFVSFSGLPSEAISISAIAALEVRSAIRRRELSQEFSRDEAKRAVSVLAAHVKTTTQQPVTPMLLLRAAALIDRHSIRALDAIQLASAVLMRSSSAPSSTIRFIASDQRLLKAAAAEGFLTWNPEQGPCQT